MEPGHEDREYQLTATELSINDTPQWSPVMKTGNTSECKKRLNDTIRPQWSPVMKTGNTPAAPLTGVRTTQPQWSPVMKTGNTAYALAVRIRLDECLNGARS